MLNRAVTRMYEEVMPSIGIKVSQVNLLVTIDKMGPVRPTRLCEVLYMDLSTVSRNIKRMKERGWVQAVPSPEGGRDLLGITPAGRDKLTEVLPIWREGQKKASAFLSDSFLEELNKVADDMWEQSS